MSFSSLYAAEAGAAGVVAGCLDCPFMHKQARVSPPVRESSERATPVVIVGEIGGSF